VRGAGYQVEASRRDDRWPTISVWRFTVWEANTYRNFHGVDGMHGLIWEWVDDFNTALIRYESRGDTDLERLFFCGNGSINCSNFGDYA